MKKERPSRPKFVPELEAREQTRHLLSVATATFDKKAQEIRQKLESVPTIWSGSQFHVLKEDFTAANKAAIGRHVAVSLFRTYGWPAQTAAPDCGNTDDAPSSIIEVCGRRVLVKTSTLKEKSFSYGWHGIFKNPRTIKGNPELLCLLGLAPFDVHLYLLPYSFILQPSIWDTLRREHGSNVKGWIDSYRPLNYCDRNSDGTPTSAKYRFVDVYEGTDKPNPLWCSMLGVSC